MIRRLRGRVNTLAARLNLLRQERDLTRSKATSLPRPSCAQKDARLLEARNVCRVRSSRVVRPVLVEQAVTSQTIVSTPPGALDRIRLMFE
ncbi:MAG: hypothetical protein WKF74_15550 [Pyrinomonadaceae bacterium]